MPVATRNGVAFHLQELGPPLAPGLGPAPPVVMLHGLLVGSLATWYFTTAPALARSHNVLLYDLRGHGLSERVATGYDVDTMRTDLEAIVEAFTTDPLTVIGHSYGAVIALRYALAHPARVNKLVLVEAPLPPSHLEELDSFLGKSPDAMADALPEALRDALGRKGRQAARLVSSLRFLATGCSLLADLRRAEDIDDAALAELRVPVLCIYGTQSSCRPVGQRLARALPNARLVELDGGHFLPIEAPARLSTVIEEFVRG
jgi:pimeloyl-ACP methyl ester carboxylesterase